MSIRRTVKLLLDKAAARKVERDLKAQSRRMKRDQERTWREVGRFIVAAFSIRVLARFTKELFRLGSAAEETASKFRTVFGSETAAELDTFLGKFGKLAGLTKREGRDMLAISGAIGQGVGLAGDQVAVFAQRIVELAGDLQSFHDIPIEETFAAIRSGTTGEAEPLKRFGIILRAVETDARALANSGKAVAKELTEAERVTARLQLITEKAGVAIGDLEKTQNSTANTARRLDQRWRQLQETLAVGVLPVFSLIINGWAEIADGAQGAVDVIGKIGRGLTNFVVNVQMIAVGLNVFFRSIPAKLTQATAAALQVLIDTFVQPAERLINRIRSLFGKEAIDLTSRLSATAERLRISAAIDLAAWRALIEEESAAILKAAEIVEDTFVAPPDVQDPDAPGLPGTIGGAFDPIDIEVDVEAAKAFLDDLDRKTQAVAEGMTSAFQGFFQANATGFAGQEDIWGAAAEAARGAGASIVEALVAGRVEEQMAAGTAALASGIWPPNPAALLAASKHFAAAALFRAIPGTIRGGGPGGGAGGAGIPRGALGSSAPGVEQPLGPEINIFLDQLSPSDPDFQRVVLGAVQGAEQRFGENVRVNVRPRTER